MNALYFINIIPLVFTLIHLSTTGWIVFNGSLNIVEFIHEDLTLNWGIQYIDMSIGDIHFQMRPPDLITFLKKHTETTTILESTIPTYYVLLSMYYIVLLLNVSFVWLGIQHYTQPRVIMHGVELSRSSYPSKHYICSKYLCYGQLAKTLLHLTVIICMYLRMGHERLCLVNEPEPTHFEMLGISVEDCYYGWQSPSYLTALLIDICITILYLGNMVKNNRRSRKRSQSGVQLLGV
jgi:hypothetical protein